MDWYLKINMCINLIIKINIWINLIIKINICINSIKLISNVLMGKWSVMYILYVYDLSCIYVYDLSCIHCICVWSVMYMCVWSVIYMAKVALSTLGLGQSYRSWSTYKGRTFYGRSRAESYRSSDLRTKVALSTVGLGQSLIDPVIYVQR